MHRHAAVDVLCVGFACVDLSFNTDHHPMADEKLRASSLTTSGGGPAANAAVAIARLGGSARFAGYLGRDGMGELHRTELLSNGVHIETIYQGAAPTPVATVLIKPNGDRANISHRSAQAIIPADAFQLRDYPARVLLLDGHQPLLSLALIQQARQLGISTLLDAGSLNDGTRMLYNQVDYLITSEQFARDFSGQNDPRSALASLDGAAPFIGVSWGAGGVYWQDEQGRQHTRAFDIEAVDTNGAGDALHGAFAYGLAQGLKPARNMRRACATAALCCLQLGARNALPSMPAVAALSGIS